MAFRCSKGTLTKMVKFFCRLFKKKRLQSQPQPEVHTVPSISEFQLNCLSQISVLSTPELMRPIAEQTEAIKARRREYERRQQAALAVLDEMEDGLRETCQTIMTQLPDVDTAHSGWALATPIPLPLRTERLESAGFFGTYNKPRETRLSSQARESSTYKKTRKTRSNSWTREPSTTPHHPSLCPSSAWRQPSSVMSTPVTSASNFASELQIDIPAHLNTPRHLA